MNDQANSFAKYTQTPWGRMHYEMVKRQLPIQGEGLRILDFGGGTCVNAAHYAQKHQVVAVEPNPDMLKLAVPGNYERINGDVSALDSIEGGFDAILCHNVLEYVPDRAVILDALVKRLKPGGILSIVKHNAPGKIMQAAVFSADPKAALALLCGGKAHSATFGDVGVYADEWLERAAKERGLATEHFYGIRAFWALIQDNEIKADDDWREEMLTLETRVQELSPFREIAFLHHFIFRKD